ncbi:hypothetical protein [Streptomyces sp. KL116D]
MVAGVLGDHAATAGIASGEYLVSFRTATGGEIVEQVGREPLVVGASEHR